MSHVIQESWKTEIIFPLYEFVIQGSRLNEQGKIPHLLNVSHTPYNSALSGKEIKAILGIETYRILISPKYFSHIIVIMQNQRLGSFGIWQMS